jgi:hypothetical protein
MGMFIDHFVIDSVIVIECLLLIQSLCNHMINTITTTNRTTRLYCMCALYIYLPVQW